MGLFDDLSGTGGGAASGGVASNKDQKTGKKAANITTFSGSSDDQSGIISKTGKQAAKKTKTTAKIENMAGDVVGAGGVPVDLLPVSVDDVSRLLPSWVSAWCDAQSVPDIRKASPQVFRALCLHIGKTYIKPSGIYMDNTRIAAGACVGSTCGRYNPAVILSLWEVYENMCATCDKIPFQTDYAAFCGVSVFYVREYSQKLTSAGVNMAKKTHEAEMDGLRRAASRDPVGRLAILNNEYWTGGGGSDSGGESVASSMPVEQTFGLIGTEKLD